MIGMEQHFIQASPIKYLATLCAHRKVLLFFGRKLFIFVDCHPSFRFVSSNAMVRAIFPVASKTRISPARKRADQPAVACSPDFGRGYFLPMYSRAPASLFGVAVARSAVRCIAFHEKAFKLRMKFISSLR
jgi:hypothetical protein